MYSVLFIERGNLYYLYIYHFNSEKCQTHLGSYFVTTDILRVFLLDFEN